MFKSFVPHMKRFQRAEPPKRTAGDSENVPPPTKRVRNSIDGRATAEERMLHKLLRDLVKLNRVISGGGEFYDTLVKLLDLSKRDVKDTFHFYLALQAIHVHVTAWAAEASGDVQGVLQKMIRHSVIPAEILAQIIAAQNSIEPAFDNPKIDTYDKIELRLNESAKAILATDLSSLRGKERTARKREQKLIRQKVVPVLNKTYVKKWLQKWPAAETKKWQNRQMKEEYIRRSVQQECEQRGIPFPYADGTELPKTKKEINAVNATLGEIITKWRKGKYKIDERDPLVQLWRTRPIPDSEKKDPPVYLPALDNSEFYVDDFTEMEIQLYLVDEKEQGGKAVYRQRASVPIKYVEWRKLPDDLDTASEEETRFKVAIETMQAFGAPETPFDNAHDNAGFLTELENILIKKAAPAWKAYELKQTELSNLEDEFEQDGVEQLRDEVNTLYDQARLLKADAFWPATEEEMKNWQDDLTDIQFEAVVMNWAVNAGVLKVKALLTNKKKLEVLFPEQDEDGNPNGDFSFYRAKKVTIDDQDVVGTFSHPDWDDWDHHLSFEEDTFRFVDQDEEEITKEQIEEDEKEQIEKDEEDDEEDDDEEEEDDPLMGEQVYYMNADNRRVIGTMTSKRRRKDATVEHPFEYLVDDTWVVDVYECEECNYAAGQQITFPDDETRTIKAVDEDEELVEFEAGEDGKSVVKSFDELDELRDAADDAALEMGEKIHVKKTEQGFDTEAIHVYRGKRVRVVRDPYIAPKKSKQNPDGWVGLKDDEPPTLVDIQYIADGQTVIGVGLDELQEPDDEQGEEEEDDFDMLEAEEDDAEEQEKDNEDSEEEDAKEEKEEEEKEEEEEEEEEDAEEQEEEEDDLLTIRGGWLDELDALVDTDDEDDDEDDDNL